MAQSICGVKINISKYILYYILWGVCLIRFPCEEFLVRNSTMRGKGHEEIPRNLQIKVCGNILESLEVFSKKKNFCFKKLEYFF